MATSCCYHIFCLSCGSDLCTDLVHDGTVTSFIFVDQCRSLHFVGTWRDLQSWHEWRMKEDDQSFYSIFLCFSLSSTDHLPELPGGRPVDRQGAWRYTWCCGTGGFLFPPIENINRILWCDLEYLIYRDEWPDGRPMVIDDIDIFLHHDIYHLRTSSRTSSTCDGDGGMFLLSFCCSPSMSMCCKMAYRHENDDIWWRRYLLVGWHHGVVHVDLSAVLVLVLVICLSWSDADVISSIFNASFLNRTDRIYGSLPIDDRYSSDLSLSFLACCCARAPCCFCCRAAFCARLFVHLNDLINLEEWMDMAWAWMIFGWLSITVVITSLHFEGRCTSFIYVHVCMYIYVNVHHSGMTTDVVDGMLVGWRTWRTCQWFSFASYYWMSNVDVIGMAGDEWTNW